MINGVEICSPQRKEIGIIFAGLVCWLSAPKERLNADVLLISVQGFSYKTTTHF